MLGGGQGAVCGASRGEESEELPSSHCVKAWIMSFTSMVPITIFSLLTVSCARAPSFFSRVMRTRLPLVTVLAANLVAGNNEGH